MRAYIVSSPYQILNSLQLEYPFKKNSDIYVLDQFSGSVALIDKLQKSESFNNVIFVGNMTREKRRRIGEFIDRNFTYSTKVSRYICDRIYDDVFFSALDGTTYMLLKYMKEKNTNMKISRIEDGLGDYISDGFMFNSAIDNLFQKICKKDVFLKREEIVSIRKNTYLYSPQLVQYTRHQEDILKLENNFIYNDFKAKINKIFQFEEKTIPTERVLVFDAATSSGTDDAYDKRMTEAVNLLNRYFGYFEVGIKLHPRRKENMYPHNHKWGDRNIPAEVYYANMTTCLSEKILVGVLSTTNVTPKIIFDEEPFIISLHKMVDEGQFTVKYSRLLGLLEGIYREKGKIYAPGNMEQLEDILRTLTIKE